MNSSYMYNQGAFKLRLSFFQVSSKDRLVKHRGHVVDVSQDDRERHAGPSSADVGCQHGQLVRVRQGIVVKATAVLGNHTASLVDGKPAMKCTTLTQRGVVMDMISWVLINLTTRHVDGKPAMMFSKP